MSNSVQLDSGNDADVLALVVAAVVEVPQLGPLRLGVPLAELVAEAEHPLLGAGLLLVAAGAAERGVELVLADGAQQREGLHRVARRDGLDDAARVDVVLHLGDDEPHARSRRPARRGSASTSSKLWPVSTCMTGNGSRPGRNALMRQVQHDDRVLAAGEQQHGPLELGGHLADDVDGLGLERPQVAELVASRGLPRLLCGRHRFLVKLVDLTRFTSIVVYKTSSGLRCQRSMPRETDYLGRN